MALTVLRRQGVATIAVLLLLAAVAAAIFGLRPAFAANGDNLASFDAVATAGIPPCSSGVGTGLAYDVTTDSIVLSCWGSNVMERVDAVTHLNDGAVTIAGLPFGNDINAMAYDAGRDRVWACNGHGHVVLIDLVAAAVDVSQPALAVAACTDGLAYDGSDDTIWASPDVSATLYHYDLAGNLLGSFNPAIGSCGNSGIAVGGPKLYLANNGCSEIYEMNKDGSGSVLFASFAPFRLEDLECDNETFAGIGKGAIWSQDAYDRILNAWEIPADQCASGGGGVVEICGDGIDNDGDGLVDEDCPVAATGRMTGGGSIADTGVRHGFELHCDAASLPNNLEVNWGKNNKFHLESLTSASCSDDPSIAPEPPAAGFDTYHGSGTGRYNGVSGYTAEWTFLDAGEPGKNDIAKIIITAPDSSVVLAVSGNLANGNHQAHAD